MEGHAPMRPTRNLLRVALVIPLLAVAAAQQAETPEALLGAALHLEEVEADLEAAITKYEEILEHAAADRAVAGRALLQIGICYEKLGKAQASAVYERVVREYADQAQTATTANQRLRALHDARGMAAARLPAEAPGVVFRQIELEGSTTTIARLSPDGTRMLYRHTHADGLRRDLNVRDLSSDEDQTLAEDVGTIQDFQWSADGERVVYAHRNAELRVIDSSDNEPTVLWSRPNDQVVVAPLDWSRDGNRILIGLFNSSDSRLAIIPASGGAPRDLVGGAADDLNWHGQFSPDGELVAGVRTKEGNTDVYLWATDGGEETRVTQHPSTDDSPFWSPDGKYLVFRSDRTKDYGLWALEMRGASPVAGPFMIRRDLGRNTLLTDFTRSGQLTMLVVGAATPADLFGLPVDPSSGEARAEFAPVSKYPAQHSFPTWSPDGKRVAYTSRKGEIGWPRIFIAGGNGFEEIEITPDDYYVVNLAWARDGEHLIFPGFRRAGQVGIFRLSLEDYAIEPLHLGDPPGPGGQGSFVNLHWLPGADRFIVQRYLGSSSGAPIYFLDRDGRELQLAFEDNVPTEAWTSPSPSGRHLAYVHGSSGEEASWSVLSLADGASTYLAEVAKGGTTFDPPAWSPDGLQVAWVDRGRLDVLSMDQAGATPRTLVAGQGGEEVVGSPTWSPDGTNLAYTVRDVSAGEGASEELWIVAAAGGDPRRVAGAPASHPRLRLVAWRPDGTIFVTGLPSADNGWGYEHWVLEGFLPEGNQR